MLAGAAINDPKTIFGAVWGIGPRKRGGQIIPVRERDTGGAVSGNIFWGKKGFPWEQGDPGSATRPKLGWPETRQRQKSRTELGTGNAHINFLFYQLASGLDRACAAYPWNWQ